MRKASIQKEWDKSADAWLDFVRTGKDHCRYYINNPGMFRMLGNINGKQVLDLACGEGYNSRIMVRKGAIVTGVDFSKNQIRHAKEKENNNKMSIEYFVQNASRLSRFKDNTFDIVACFMALQDMNNYRKVVKELKRVLKTDGRFVFAIPHPCFERNVGRDGIPYTVKDYFTAKAYPLYWKMKRLTKYFKTTSFHRSLSDYTNALRDAGLLISRIHEPKPTKQGCKVHPNLKENLLIPQSIVIEAIKR
jgi:ubiquinone/menaquinone biosynthesis C-methylase UbiE